MNDQTATQVGTFARLGLGLAAGYLVSKGKLDPATAETLVGLALTVGTAAWGYTKNKSAK